ncbi:hypothetical protein E5288_WYG003084 [Bos mutus]|uniref:Uncharacterized protein n=1 Tax=Bos mutus TaxID=72004 RepID=A0A6B0RFZ5_9CETA|nr:hypothetical protein [Bos mutus]
MSLDLHTLLLRSEHRTTGTEQNRKRSAPDDEMYVTDSPAGSSRKSPLVESTNSLRQDTQEEQHPPWGQQGPTGPAVDPTTTALLDSVSLLLG